MAPLTRAAAALAAQQRASKTRTSSPAPKPLKAPVGDENRPPAVNSNLSPAALEAIEKAIKGYKPPVQTKAKSVSEEEIRAPSRKRLCGAGAFVRFFIFVSLLSAAAFTFASDALKAKATDVAVSLKEQASEVNAADLAASLKEHIVSFKQKAAKVKASDIVASLKEKASMVKGADIAAFLKKHAASFKEQVSKVKYAEIAASLREQALHLQHLSKAVLSKMEPSIKYYVHQIQSFVPPLY
eukprot:TRINITY_DN20781_c0_g1_i1.p1 TRINITY_DN20781_c0_g1~~TRINITY_DN20781_c0_g1_i1.p1  ORF type:complete len:241 (-),score=75.21 TRINITY_DN20781_c0_g1_i1:106-828(-)